MGEHQEWTKHTNFDLPLRIPLMVYVPGVTAAKSTPGKTFPFQDAFETEHMHRAKNCSKTPRLLSGPLRTDALVEAVDMYATLSELAGLEVPPTCPPDPFRVAFCTEGFSFAPLIHRVVKGNASPRPDAGRVESDVTWKKAVFSQYPRPSFTPARNTISPSLNVRVDRLVFSHVTSFL